MKEIYFTKPLNNLQNYSLTNPPLKTVPGYGEPLKGGYAFLCYSYTMLFYAMCTLRYIFGGLRYILPLLRNIFEGLRYIFAVYVASSDCLYHPKNIHNTPSWHLLHTSAEPIPHLCPVCSSQVSTMLHTSVPLEPHLCPPNAHFLPFSGSKKTVCTNKWR